MRSELSDTDLLAKRGPGRPRIGQAPAEIVPVRMPPELKAEIEHLAREQETSLSEIVRAALRDYLASR